MRNTLLIPFFLLSSLANAAIPDVSILPFEQPLLEEPYYIDNATSSPDLQLELVKRQNDGCARGYANCATLGAGGLCCPTAQACARDGAGNVACCPPRASCTGTIRPVTNTGGGVFIASTTGTNTLASTTITGGGAATIGVSTTTEGGIVFVGASATTGSGTQQASGAMRSYVNNPYYPYAFIPTTYTNAADCSSAYTTCHADFTSCSNFLAGLAGAGGVTVSVAGGGGTTIAASGPSTTLLADAASSVCASLSGSACYGLTVEACGAFGVATATNVQGGMAARCVGMRFAAGIGAGLAIGMVEYG
jgi:hypothetical protein